MVTEEQKTLFIARNQITVINYSEKELLKNYIDIFGMTSLLYFLSEIVAEEYEKKPEEYLSDLMIDLTKAAIKYNKRNEGEVPNENPRN